MGAVIVRRVAVIPPLLVLVSFMVFCLAGLLPGDAAMALLGDNATPERVEQIRQELRLDDHFVVRYGSWLGKVAQGDFGKSFATRREIANEIRLRLPITASIALGALAVALLLGIPAGLLVGMLQRRKLDRAVSFCTSAALAMPYFWLGTILVVIFAVDLRWLPATGYVPIDQSAWEWLRRLILPVITLGLMPGAELSRQLRSGLITISQEAYIRTAWAKGLSVRQVMGKHALRNAATPALTVLGLRFGHLLAGSAIVEDMFGIPGIGKFTIDAISNRDIPALQGVVLVSAVIIVAANLCVDILNALLTPKARVS